MQERRKLKLIRRAKKGDTRAFEILVKEYSTYLTCIALKVLNNDHDAQEAVQNAVLSMYQNLSSIKNDHAFNTWVYTIVYNASLKVYRKRGKELSLDEVGEDNLEEAQTFFLPEHSHDARHDKELLLEKIKDLPHSYQVALFLFYFEELSCESIATIMDSSAHDVTNWLYRARKKLGKMIAEDERTAHLSQKASSTEGAALSAAFSLDTQNTQGRYGTTLTEAALAKMIAEGILVGSTVTSTYILPIMFTALIAVGLLGASIFSCFFVPDAQFFPTQAEVTSKDSQAEEVTVQSEETTTVTLLDSTSQSTDQTPLAPPVSTGSTSVSTIIKNTATYEVTGSNVPPETYDNKDSAISGTTNTVLTTITTTENSVAKTGDSPVLGIVLLMTLIAASVLLVASYISYKLSKKP